MQSDYAMTLIYHSVVNALKTGSSEKSDRRVVDQTGISPSMKLVLERTQRNIVPSSIMRIDRISAITYRSG